MLCVNKNHRKTKLCWKSYSQKVIISSTVVKIKRKIGVDIAVGRSFCLRLKVGEEEVNLEVDVCLTK